MFISRILYSAIPGLACLATDIVLNLMSKNNEEFIIYLRAITDNVSHGTVALLSWLAVIRYRITTEQIYLCLMCFLIGSLIDLDHFVLAGSLKLKDALHLSRRPPLHSSSLVVLIIPILAIYGLYRPQLCWQYDLPFCVFTAVLSHHLRDANRRGLWFAPWFETRPLPTVVYVALEILLPLSVHICRNAVFTQVKPQEQFDV